MPYYESERATLYCGDAGDVLAGMPKVSYDLLVTDPPYGQEWQSNKRARDERFKPIAGDGAGDGDKVAAIVALAVDRLRPYRHVYVFGPPHLTADLPLGSTAELIWDKGQIGNGDLSLPWGSQHEPITFGMYVPSKAGRERGSGRLSARLRQGSILHAQRANSTGVKRHPTEKPVALIRRLIESSSCLGETVCDPFAGSGSTLIAALMEGRRAIGVELDSGYCDLIVRRLRWVEQILDKLDMDGELADEAVQLAISY